MPKKLTRKLKADIARLPPGSRITLRWGDDRVVPEGIPAIALAAVRATPEGLVLVIQLADEDPEAGE